MSVHIELIGYRKDRRTYDAINSINDSLREIGIAYQLYFKNLPDHIILPGLSLRTSDLNCLKNVFLELESNPNWTTESDSLFIGEDRYFFFDLAKEIFGEKQSHFVWHDNYWGCYVPVDFQDIPTPDDFLKTLGSSITLCHELKERANKIKLNLGDYTPDF